VVHARRFDELGIGVDSDDVMAALVQDGACAARPAACIEDP
jgi:hypothetical protein